MMRLVIAASGVFLLASIVTATAETNTSAQFFPRFQVGDGFYDLSTERVTWLEAKKRCSRLGTDLISIETSTESNGVLSVISSLTSESFWTSGTDLLSEGSFYWDSTGAGVTDGGFNWWAPGEPTGYGNCLQAWGQEYFMWDDFDCNSQLLYVCEFHDTCP